MGTSAESRKFDKIKGCDCDLRSKEHLSAAQSPHLSSWPVSKSPEYKHFSEPVRPSAGRWTTQDKGLRQMKRNDHHDRLRKTGLCSLAAASIIVGAPVLMASSAHASTTTSHGCTITSLQPQDG